MHGLHAKMDESKKKRIAVGVTIAAVILFVFLLVFWIGQMISIGVKNNRISDLNEQIARYEQLIGESQDDLTVYRSEAWLEYAAWLIEMYGYDDVVFGGK